MEYKEALDYLFAQLPMFSRVGAAAYKPGLDTSLNLDKYYNHPHRNFKSIHVGGTNGKGSTSHLLASILQSQDYKVGLYTSPHLADFRERIRVNGEMIPQADVVDFVERYQRCDYDGHPSFFELTMMMAFDYFSRSNVDYAVIEVGMGGRLDSTNIITPEACIITNISWDHTQFLGDTLEKIAAEKAGIIKHGIPVVIGEAEGSIREVFARKAEEVGTQITFAEDTHLIRNFNSPDDFEDIRGNKLSCPLLGDYQKKNINTVMAAVEMLRNIGIEISDDALMRGFADVCRITGFMGRWTCLSKSPLVICDTGHNQAGLQYNMAQLQRLMSQRPEATLHIVMGFVADKDIDHIINMFPKTATYYITNAAIPRALPVERLAERCRDFGLSFTQYPNVAEAYGAALQAAKGNFKDNSQDTQDIVYVGGSTFIVADLLAVLSPKRLEL